MRVSTFKKFVAIVLVCLFVLVIKDIPLTQLQGVPKEVSLTSQDIIDVNNDRVFGRYIKLETDEIKAVSSEGAVTQTNLEFKLFGFINVNRVKANIVDDSKIYVGGNPVGFSLSSDGVIVIGSNAVLTKEGRVDTLKNSNVKIGDVIKEVRGIKVTSVDDIEKIINDESASSEEIKIKAIRKNKEINLKLKPAFDMQTKKYKMGLWVRNDAAGVGTLTYVRKDNGRFGALGHAICDADTKVAFDVNEGTMYKSNIIGVKKARRGVPGELKGLFLSGKNSQGKVDKNTEFGVFGTIDKESKLIDSKNLLSIGGRLTARPGRAKIRVALSGYEPKEYDIEIIKTNYQSASKQKSMVIKVTDKELIKKTGGIVQGMSGSPIIQNGKIIGAVTHVFVNDPKKGFGLYLDWMINL